MTSSPAVSLAFEAHNSSRGHYSSTNSIKAKTRSPSSSKLIAEPGATQKFKQKDQSKHIKRSLWDLVKVNQRQNSERYYRTEISKQ